MNSQPSNQLRLGILICGHSAEAVVAEMGTYDKAFMRLLGPESFDYQVFSVVDNEFPESTEAADAWLLTGSKHGVYDNLAWIASLENFVREIYEQGLPLVGICFGHQLIAQALGGKVEKFAGGWIAGTEHYQFSDDTPLDSVVLNAWHQDQVVEKPDDARVVASSAGCQVAALEYRTNTISLQAHPEFDNNYLSLLLEHRSSALTPNVLEQARNSHGQNLTSQPIADWLKQALTSGPNRDR